MTFNAGIVTNEFAATKAFYIEQLGFELVFENEFYVLLAGFGDRISFLRPEHPTQAPIFRPPARGTRYRCF